MIPFPQYNPERETLQLWSYKFPLPAGSLEARQFENMLAVASPVTGELICAWIPFDQWTLPDGTTLPDVGTAFAYLNSQCQGRAAVVLQDQFAQFANQHQTSTYQLASVTSYTAQHGLPYAPATVLLDDVGNLVETDVIHAPGQVTLIFPQPFTGTLYIT